MRVKITNTVSGNICGHWSPKAGDEIEVPDHVGALLCKRKIAEPVAVKNAKVETRTESAPAAPKPKRTRATRAKAAPKGKA